jgi:hypothetical protein
MSNDNAPDDGALSAAHEESQPPDERARDEGRRAVDAAIVRMARAAGAPVHERPIAVGYGITAPDTEPLAGIGFALMLTDAAGHEIHRYIQRARQDGAGWRQIGQALRLERDVQERGGDLGAEAFEYAAGSPAQRFDRLWFHWTCPACQQAITDYGPYDSHPDDCERGHADGCQRRAAAVAAYQAQWDDED